MSLTGDIAVKKKKNPLNVSTGFGTTKRCRKGQHFSTILIKNINDDCACYFFSDMVREVNVSKIVVELHANKNLLLSSNNEAIPIIEYSDLRVG